MPLKHVLLETVVQLSGSSFSLVHVFLPLIGSMCSVKIVCLACWILSCLNDKSKSLWQMCHAVAVWLSNHQSPESCLHDNGFNLTSSWGVNAILRSNRNVNSCVQFVFIYHNLGEGTLYRLGFIPLSVTQDIGNCIKILYAKLPPWRWNIIPFIMLCLCFSDWFKGIVKA